MRWLLISLILTCPLGAWAQKYNGPRPPKPDVLYLVQASTLVETEVQEAKEEGKKDETTFVIPGANSPARTPLAEPIFLLLADRIQPDRLELYKLEVKNGRREVTMTRKARRSARPLRIAVTPLGDRLYRIEADEYLEDGEYSISPSDSNRVFCFEIY